MESPVFESQGVKRKRTPQDDGARPTPPHVTTTGGGGSAGNSINYLIKPKPDKLRLIEVDSDSFSGILGIIDDYEGVLQRHESLAASLGAKLVGPLLFKTLERLFDGPIKVIESSFAIEQAPVTWLDIITLDRSNPAEFVLVDSVQGKVCRIWIKDGQVEISEDDYRLILSGAPERILPPQPVAEDESAEMETLNILESRLGMLIKKADAVASKARQLNYHLKGRRSAILARKAEQSGTPIAELPFTPQSFVAVNSRSPAPTNGDAKRQQELLEQFMSTDRRGSLAHPPKSKAGRAAVSEAPVNGDVDVRRLSQPITSSDDGVETKNRALMAERLEKLARGDVITPPCDRCRRLKFECTKYISACQSCTKKHAKCSWKDTLESEILSLPDPDQLTGKAATDQPAMGEHVIVVENGGPATQVPKATAPEAEQKTDAAPFVYPGAQMGGSSNHTSLTQIAAAAAAGI